MTNQIGLMMSKHSGERICSGGKCICSGGRSLPWQGPPNIRRSEGAATTEWRHFMRMLAPSLAVLLVSAGAGLLGGKHLLAQAGPAGQSSSAGTPQTAKKLAASAIQIEPVENGDVALPPEFRVAVYEHLLEEVSKSGKFQHVYRSGDRSAGDVPDLVILHMKTKNFKHGSERTRAVTTVAGATSLDLGVQITGRDGNVLLDRDVTGKVRFIGGNLRATYDFSKKVAGILKQSF